MVSPEADARTVADLGEFGLIARVAGRLGAPPPPAGPGDDAAVVAAPGGRLLASTDVLVEGRHFRRDWSSAEDIGHRAAAANLADIAAMGGTATALLLAVALPGQTLLADVDGLVDGIRDECATVGAQVVGGDTSAASQWFLAITVLGTTDGPGPVLRSGAQPGDELVLVGRTGLAAAGLDLLRELGPGAAAAHPEAVAALRRPAPPYAAGPALAAAGARALCDVSDGLLADAGHLAEASGVAMRLDVTALAAQPWAAPLRRAAATLAPGDVDGAIRRWLATGGDDHPLLAALPPGTPLPAGAVRVGSVVRGSGVTLRGGTPTVPGHQHFTADS